MCQRFGSLQPFVPSIVDHLEVLRVAIKGDVGAAIAVQVGHHQLPDALVGGDGINAETRVGRQFIDFEFARRAGRGRWIGFARLIVKQIDFGAQIVGDDEVVQAVAVQIRRVQEVDLIVNRKDFRPGETETVRGIFTMPGESKSKNQRRQNTVARQFHSLHKHAQPAIRRRAWPVYSTMGGTRSKPEQTVVGRAVPCPPFVRTTIAARTE